MVRRTKNISDMSYLLCSPPPRPLQAWTHPAVNVNHVALIITREVSSENMALGKQPSSATPASVLLG
ncbi:hypothetical protein J6590_043732 [Homalodisca vitripennis]|nr:hypothetical protein J6590_043732 [Homalodisca vitripennis]